MKLKYLFLFSFLSLPVHAAISDSKAVNTILGEAAGESYQGKLAIACVIRNRGSIQGFYGANRPQVWYDKQGKKALADCQKAWSESATNDITHGCNLEGGKIDDNYFLIKLKLKPVMTIGNQRFYKSK
jgi:hypothetical protein